MNNISFSEPERSVSEEDLTRVANHYQFSFPRSLKEHYLAINGGQPDPCLFPTNDGYCVISEFLPVRHGEGTLEGVIQDLKIDRQVIPPWLVPFAVDPGGDYFCFSIRKKGYGSIYFFQGEYLPDLDRAVTKLAESFDQFMEGVVAEEEAKDDPGPIPTTQLSSPKLQGKRNENRQGLLTAAISILQKSRRKMNCPELLEAIGRTGGVAEGPTEQDKITLFNALMAETRRGVKSQVKLETGGFRYCRSDTA